MFFLSFLISKYWTMKTMHKILILVFFFTALVKADAQEIPIHLLRVEDSTLIGQLIAPIVDGYGETTYQSIPIRLVNDSTLLVGVDTVIHTGNIENYATADWANLIGVPDSLVYQSELADSTAAVRADFPVPDGIGTDAQNLTLFGNEIQIDNGTGVTINNLANLYQDKMVGYFAQTPTTTQKRDALNNIGFNAWTDTTVDLDTEEKPFVAQFGSSGNWTNKPRQGFFIINYMNLMQADLVTYNF